MMRRVAALVSLCITLLMLVSVPRGVAQTSSTASQSQTSAPDSEYARQVTADLKAILSQPEFVRQEPKKSALEDTGKWIREKIAAFLNWLGKLLGLGARAGGASGQIVYWLILGGLLVGMIWLIAFAIRKFDRRKVGAQGKVKPQVTASTIEPEESSDATPESWIEAARALAALGDYRRAYRAVFVATLLRLDRLGAVQFDRARTNGEYLRTLRKSPALLAIMRPVTNEFDARWYGRLEVGQPDFERLVKTYELVSAQESSPGAAATS